MIHRWHYEHFCRIPGFRFSIEYSVFPAHTFELHTHDFAELVVVRHGAGVHHVKGAGYAIGAGDAFVIRPDEVHGYTDIEGLDLCNVIFDPNLFLAGERALDALPGYRAFFHLEPEMRDAYRSEGRLHLSLDEMRYVYDLVDPMAEEYKRAEPGFEVMIRAYFLLLAGYLSRKYAEQTTRASRELVRLSNVVGFIEAHFRESLTLSDLVDVACMSESTLLRAFKRCYGTTPVDYVIRYRLKEACDLMGETTCSLSDVAQMVGFSDSNYFSRRFHREYGMSPRDYRRRLTSQT